MPAKILIVDDEPMIRSLVGTILKIRGYDVYCAEDPEKAMAVLEEQPDLDLLLTDMIMPKMTGTALAKVLSQRKPSLRVLFMSGFAPEYSSRSDSGADPHDYLRKPFLVPELLAKVEGILV